VAAGNTALCTVGRTGNDLAYRGYDILALAETCEFEEVAHLLVHGKLPTVAELAAYKAKLSAARRAGGGAQHARGAARLGAPDGRDAHRRLGARLRPAREGRPQPRRRARHRRPLLASLGSMLLVWYHWSHNGRRIEVETDDDTIGGHFLHLLHGRAPNPLWVRAMHTSLNLYAEHEFNASTFTARVVAGTGSDMYSRSPAPSARCAGPSTAAPTRWRSRSRSATTRPTRPRPTSASASSARRS
jgi:2-methylcitrate synthase